MKVVISFVLAGIVLILTSPVHAHHSTTAFYLVDEQFEITGIVTEVRLVNPHSYMRVEVTEPSGEKVVWTVYGGNRNQMTDEPGWELGRTVTAVGCPARNPAAHAMYQGLQCPVSKLTLTSGQ